jgi:carbonic anhydrase
MKKLVTGFQRFRNQVFEEHRDLFAQLAAGQSPQALFVTCSDSRIQPNLLTQTEPGDLFVLRNAGNIVPPYTPTASAEAGTIEYAIEALGVEHVVVCGHSQCGAMKAILDDEPGKGMPAVAAWLAHAEPTRRVLRDLYAKTETEERLSIAIQENVLQQIVNLRSHPSIAARLANGRVHLHAWVYKITTGEIFAYDPANGQFKPLVEVSTATLPPRALSDVFGP